MDVSHILDELNDAQRNAVTSDDQYLLVLAGAGSGKTRVLVHRIAWQIQAQGLNPYSVLAVTFTNKAANEMSSRIQTILKNPVSELWCGTFHGIAHRTLKMFNKEANLPPGFSVIDAEDQLRIIKRIMKDEKLDDALWPSKQIQWLINSWKEEGKRSKYIKAGNDLLKKAALQTYVHYEKKCADEGLVDFAELLLKAYELVQSHPVVKSYFHKRFASILIDEFQDTNTIQFKWLLEILSNTALVTAVGDDDQSIYGWRGARAENILGFDKSFKAAKTVRLEQNYRSTSVILDAANALISNNQNRLGKNLWTKLNKGEPITLYQAYHEQDEARYIADTIKNWMNSGGSYGEAAVVYRSNAQSRAIEEALLRIRIPYRIYGGTRFYERMEIKNALSYLKLAFNSADNLSFERAISNPPRGIGQQTLQNIRDASVKFGISNFDAAVRMSEERLLASKAKNSIDLFTAFIESIKNNLEELSLSDAIDRLINFSGLIEMYEKEKGEKGKTRIENLEELVTAAKIFEDDFSKDTSLIDIAETFLDNVSLDAGDAQAGEHEDAVQLMTLHSAKGLEFPLVFICGLEETLFPHIRSMDSPEQLEEERRLCYVGITRAKQKLYITYAEIRKIHGSDVFNPPSRFIREIPAELMNEVRPRASVTFSYERKSLQAPKEFKISEGISLGQRVAHKKFGQGIVLNYEGAGDSARVQINFDKVGSKWLVLSFANLEVL
ncbi:MAG: DNA helicase II [Gammaproteobacteria bacterium]